MTLFLALHSLLRWLVVISLLVAIFIAWRGYKSSAVFGKVSNLIRHWTATIVHIQLIVGLLVAMQSSYFVYVWDNTEQAWANSEAVFYGLIHPLLMLIAITVVTIGSAKTKRMERHKEKFKTMLIFYVFTLIILFIAIPWPFSPFSARPLIPNF